MQTIAIYNIQVKKNRRFMGQNKQVNNKSLLPTIKYAFGKAILACMSCLACPVWNMSYMPSAYTRTGLGAV